jgi:type III secretion protein V
LTGQLTDRGATLSRFTAKLRLSDIGLVSFLVIAIVMIIVPLPPLMIDICVAINISVGMILLITALYVEKPLDFSTFPTILLITTLFRLAISIAATRLILIEAEGGDIITQFGNMVAGGQIAVGLVIFLIITIVQFIVVAKGAERVAEVAARFSLDAMPGKQLSIDSDLRSGILTKEEAKEKRRTLEMESKFNGSLDGAMKFVKGDAICSIVIVLVNLVGGLAVGMFSHGMDAATAAKTFSILSIGDGLVAQLPALFSAFAAGLLVTRSSDDSRDGNLAQVIALQVGGKPHVMFIAAGMSVLLGIIPGFPTLVFLGLALFFATVGLFRHPVWGGAAKEKLGLASSMPLAPIGQARLAAPQVAPIEPLKITVAMRGDTPEFVALTDHLQKIVTDLQNQSGVTIPPLSVSAEGADRLPEYSWSLSAYDAPLGSGVSGAEDQVKHISMLVEHLLNRNLSLFLGLQEVTDMLNRLGDEYPEVVKEAVRAVPTGKIAEVLRLLVDEGVPIRNLRDAIEAIADIGQYERDGVPIAERTRIAMRRHLIAPLCEDGRLRALMVGSELEDIIRQTLTDVDGQMRLAINPMQMRALIALLEEQAMASGAKAILTSQDLRRPLRLLIAADLPQIPVISFNELNPSVPLDIVGELNRAPDTLTSETPMEFAE